MEKNGQIYGLSESIARSIAWEIIGRQLIQFYLRICSQLVSCRSRYIKRHGVPIMEFEQTPDDHLMRVLERN